MEKIMYHVEPVNPSSWNGLTKYANAKEGIRAAILEDEVPVTGLDTKQRSFTDFNGTTKKYFGSQDFMEQMLNMKKGKLDSGSVHEPNPFWINYVVQLKAGVNEIDGSKPLGYLKLLFLAAQPEFAVGRDNIESMSEWVIISPEDEVSDDFDRRDKYHDAVVALKGASSEQRRAVIYVMGANPKGKSDKAIYRLLDDQAMNNPDKVIELLKDVTLTNKAFISRCVFERALAKRGEMYYNGSNLIGASLTEAVEYLFSEVGKDLLISLKEKLS